MQPRLDQERILPGSGDARSKYRPVVCTRSSELLTGHSPACSGRTGETGRHVAPPLKTGNSWSNILCQSSVQGSSRVAIGIPSSVEGQQCRAVCEKVRRDHRLHSFHVLCWASVVLP
ncbi:hypothetical protein SRHO_G00338480 [Serrasalmus rhombeus]